MARATQPMDTIILSMTSGTTSLPKFAEVTHYQLVYGHAINDRYVDTRQSDNWLSFSPYGLAGRAGLRLRRASFEWRTGELPRRARRPCRPICARSRRPACSSPAASGRIWRAWCNSASTTAVGHQSRPVSHLHAHRLSRHRPGRHSSARYRRPCACMRWLGEYAIFEPLRDKLGIDAGAQCADRRAPC